MRDTPRLNLVLKLFFGIATCAFVTPLFAQTNPQANPCDAPGAPHNAANWSRVPQAARPDTLSAEARKAQDDYFSRFYPYNLAYVDPDQPNGSWSKQTASLPPSYVPFQYSIIGTILSYEVHEVPGKAIYTDLHIRVDRIADNHQDKPNEPVVGSIVDVGAIGGCLITASGEVHGQPTELGTARTQPGHRYLLLIWHTDVNGLYVMRSDIDLTSGVAQPVHPSQVKAVREGHWPYAGMNEDMLINRMRKENPNN